jgi:hypothetical protein
MAKDREDVSMNSKTRWHFAGAAVLALAVGLLIASTVSAQTAPAPANPGMSVCPGPAMMGGGFGRGPAVGGFGPGAMHEAVANALGITSQEMWDAQAAGKSIATLAQERNVDLTTVVAATVAAHSAQLEAAVKAGTFTQAQADAMTAFMKGRIESAFGASTAVGPRGFGMMGGRGGMMGPGFGPAWRTAP